MRPFALLASLGAVQVHSLNLNFKVLVRFPDNRSVPIYINETTGAYLPETDIVYDNPNYLEDYIVLNTPPPAAAPTGAAGAGAAGASDAGTDAFMDGSDGSDGTAPLDGSYNQGDSGAGTDAIVDGSDGTAPLDGSYDQGAASGGAGAAGGAAGAGSGSGSGAEGSSGGGGSSGSSPEAAPVTPKEVEDYIQDANNYLEHYNGYMEPQGVFALMSTKARLREAAIKAALPKMLHVENGLSVEELERRMETKASPQTKLGRVLYSHSAPEWYNNFIVNSLEASHKAPVVQLAEVPRAAPVSRHAEAKEEVEQQKAVEVDNAGKILPKEGKQAKAEHLKEP